VETPRRPRRQPRHHPDRRRILAVTTAIGRNRATGRPTARSLIPHDHWSSSWRMTHPGVAVGGRLASHLETVADDDLERSVVGA
jgi:hypothetical protein